MDLSTTYLGLKLANPFIAGASPLSGTLDMVKRLEDGGAAAIVLPSLFEEQIREKRLVCQSGRATLISMNSRNVEQKSSSETYSTRRNCSWICFHT
jgi:dihydroorotate dehydrogenase